MDVNGLLRRKFMLSWCWIGMKQESRLFLHRTGQWEKCGTKRVKIVGTGNKQQITTVFCSTMLGDFLPVGLVYWVKSAQCHPKFQFFDDWDFTHSPSHGSTDNTMLQYTECIILPHVERVRSNTGRDKAALVVVDNFIGQTTESILKPSQKHSWNNNTHLYLCKHATT